MWPAIAGTTALTTLGAVVRYSRATMHNQWSDRHYAFLEGQAGQPGNAGYAGAIENERKDNGQSESPKR